MKRFVTKKRFVEVVAIIPFMWAADSEWSRDPSNHTYDMVREMLCTLGTKRSKQLSTRKKTLDEDMFEHKPKHKKSGELPRIAYEPRKPVDTGTEFKTLRCAFTSLTLVMEVCEGINNKIDAGESLKKWHKQAKLGGWGAGAAVDIRTVETGGGLDKGADGKHLQQGSVTCKDAHFGSILDAVMIKQLFNQESHSIIKNNSSGCPTEEMYSRLSGKNRGACIVMTATVDGVYLMCIGFRFNHATKPNIFLTTTGDSANGVPYLAKFQDDDGQVAETRLERPLVMPHAGATALLPAHLSARQHTCPPAN